MRFIYPIITSLKQGQPFPGILQNRSSQKFRRIQSKTSVVKSLFNKFASLQGSGFIKKTPAQVFCCEF